MQKILAVFFMLWAVHSPAQLVLDFGHGGLAGWEQYPPARWGVEPGKGLGPDLALHHVYDHAAASRDRIAYHYPVNLQDTVFVWRFRVQYERQPSGSNNWGFFLAADQGAPQMHPSGRVNGYVAGVNYSGSDDCIKLWKVQSGSGYQLLNTGFNWQEHISPHQAVGVEVTRGPGHLWTIAIDTTGGFGRLQTLGSVRDSSRLRQQYFGLYYEYTATGDRCLWVDDIYLGPPVGDTLRPEVSGHRVVHSSLLEIAFTERIDSADLANPGSYTWAGDGPGIAGVASAGQKGRLVRLQTASPLAGGLEYWLKLQGVHDVNGNPMRDTLLPFVFRKMTVDTAFALSGDSLAVFFSREVDSAAASHPGHYTLMPDRVHPVDVLPDTLQAHRVTLVFDRSFRPGVVYELVVMAVPDCHGDAMAPGSVTFFRGCAAPFDVVISEIMADPFPSAGLPQAEYVELYNRSGRRITLSGWQLHLGDATATLETSVMGPRSRLILCESDHAGDFLQYGPVCSLEGMAAIANRGQDLMLTDRQGRMVSFVCFSDHWYGDAFKAEGGWSLEQVDPANPCGGADNWSASLDLRGGTPGAANSVGGSNPDDEDPRFSHLGLLAPSTLVLHFSEPLREEGCANVEQYELQGVGHPREAKLLKPDFTRVSLLFDRPLRQGRRYRLSVASGLCDCAGNALPGDVVVDFALPRQASAGDLVINEVLFNPRPGGKDFVEVYNRSSKYIDLGYIGIKALSDPAEEDRPPVPLSYTSRLIFPGQYMVFTSSPVGVQQHYHVEVPDHLVKVVGFPRLPREKGSLVLAGAGRQALDRMSYDAGRHFFNPGAIRGASLERVHFDRPSDDATNWHVAAQSAGFGTPTYRNSQFAGPQKGSHPVWLEPEVFSPDNDGKDDMLHVHYRFRDPGNTASVRVYDARGRLVRLLVSHRSVATEGVFSWDGRDDDQRRARMGIYLVDFEVWGTGGKTRRYRKACVLAGRRQ